MVSRLSALFHSIADGLLRDPRLQLNLLLPVDFLCLVCSAAACSPRFSYTCCCPFGYCLQFGVTESYRYQINKSESTTTGQFCCVCTKSHSIGAAVSINQSPRVMLCDMGFRAEGSGGRAPDIQKAWAFIICMLYGTIQGFILLFLVAVFYIFNCNIIWSYVILKELLSYFLRFFNFPY